MLRINKTLIAALLTVASFVAAPALYADRYERTFSRTQTYQGGRISIDHSMGPVTVHAGSGNDVRVHALIRASDSEIGKDINVTVSTSSANGIMIRTEYPAMHFHGNVSLSYSVDLDVTMPANAPLTVHNKFGSVDVTGIHAAGEIVNAQGPVVLRDSRGTQRVESSFGSILIERSAGDTSVQNANGSVRIDDVDGTLGVTNRFGPVTVNNVHDVTIRNGNGAVEVLGVAGNATIVDSFDTVRIANVSGNLELNNQNGRVDVRDIKGRASIKNSFDATEFANIGRDLIISANNGRVEGSHVGTGATTSLDRRASPMQMAT
jgi:hypothetical protein